MPRQLMPPSSALSRNMSTSSTSTNINGQHMVIITFGSSSPAQPPEAMEYRCRITVGILWESTRECKLELYKNISRGLWCWMAGVLVVGSLISGNGCCWDASILYKFTCFHIVMSDCVLSHIRSIRFPISEVIWPTTPSTRETSNIVLNRFYPTTLLFLCWGPKKVSIMSRPLSQKFNKSSLIRSKQPRTS